MRIAVMFGAGASCAGPGLHGFMRAESDSLEGGNPPLGAGLFEVLRSLYGQYWGDSVEEHFKSDPGDFEAGMERMYNSMWRKGTPESRNRFSLCLFRMAEYFNSWDLKSRDNLYSRFIQQLLDREVLTKSGLNPEFSFISLNYEQLLEMALVAEGIRPTILSGFNYDYQPRVSVWKPHGSANFVASARQGTVGFPTLQDLDGGLSLVPRKSFPRYLGDLSRQLDRKYEIPSLVVMSLFMRKKPTIIGQKAIKAIRRSYLSDVSASDLLIMIGVRPVASDKHLFKPILARSKETLFVGFGGHELEKFSENCEGKVTHVARTFEEAIDDAVFDPWLTPS